MKILVCFKEVPEFDQVVDADWDDFSRCAGLPYVKRDFGCFDQTALETALRLADELKESGAEAACSALTVGPLSPALRRTLFAAGFERVFAPPPDFLLNTEFRPAAAAAALKKIIIAAQTRWDLILTGKQAGYADTGMVPLLLAEQLSLPVISGAELVSLGDAVGGADSVVIERAGENGRERLIVRLPAVVSMGNSPVSSLRAATLAAQMKAAKREAEWLGGGAGDFVVGKADEMPVLTRERLSKNCVFLPAGDALAQSAAQLDKELRARGTP